MSMDQKDIYWDGDNKEDLQGPQYSQRPLWWTWRGINPSSPNFWSALAYYVGVWTVLGCMCIVVAFFQFHGLDWTFVFQGVLYILFAVAMGLYLLYLRKKSAVDHARVEKLVAQWHKERVWRNDRARSL